MRVRGWLLAAATLCATAPIEARQSAPQCVDGDSGRSRCGPDEERRLLELYGMRAIPSLRESGDQVRRAFYTDGFDQDVFAISFVRAMGREPQVSVTFPRRSGEAPWTMEAAVSLATWNDVLARSRFFDRALAPLSDDAAESICMHPSSALVESSDVAGEPFDTGVRRQYGSACPTGLAFVYAVELMKSAEPLFGFCQSLDARMNRLSILDQCGRLRGDRVAAAQVFKRMDECLLALAMTDPKQVAQSFSREATAEWAGERSQPGKAADFWLGHAGPGQYVHIAVDLVTAPFQREARVVGRLTQRSERSAGMQFEVASIEVRWTRDSLSGDFLIEHVTVGAFTPDPGR
jgi:hypothetical protein